MQNIILAAGLGTRSEGKKLLLPYKNQSIITTAVRASLQADLMTIVVTGYRHDLIEKELQSYQCEKLKLVYNEHFAKGQGSSTLCGVAHLKADQPFFISLADMPLIESRHYLFLMEYKNYAAVRPMYKGRLGHPVMLQPAFIPIIKNQKESFTMRSLLSQFTVHQVQVDEEAYILDIDTLAEYHRMIKSVGQPPQCPQV